MNERYVLDSYAVLALLQQERGSEKVAHLAQQAQVQAITLSMTWVNLGEVAYIVERRWGKGKLYQILGMIGGTGISFISAERELTLSAASFKAKFSLSYADAFAAALALREDAVLVTGDPAFKPLVGILQVGWLS